MKIFVGNLLTCNLNYQPEYITTLLEDNFETTDKAEEADIIVFPGACSCTQQHIYTTINYIASVLEKKNPQAKTYLTGCITREFITSKLHKAEKWLQDNIDYIIPYDRPDILLKKISEEKFSNLKSEFGLAFHDAEAQEGALYISTGCLNNCTFCKATFQKLALKSQKIEIVKAIIDEYDKKGIKELIIKGTNISQYGLDLYSKYMLPEVIEYIEKKNNIKKVSLIGMGYKDAIHNDFASVLKDSKKVVEIGGSLESGSDRLLELMHKGFTSEEIINFVETVREKYSKKLILNIIAGFPTENLEDIKKTLEVLKILSPTKVDICRYMNSVFVDSNKYPQLSLEEINDNTRIYQKVLTKRNVENAIVGGNLPNII